MVSIAIAIAYLHYIDSNKKELTNALLLLVIALVSLGLQAYVYHWLEKHTPRIKQKPGAPSTEDTQAGSGQNDTLV